MKSKYYFGTKYTLSVIPNPDSSYGTTTGSGKYKKGAQVQISASPNTGYKFLQWREGETDTNPRTVTVNQDATFNALFTRIPTRDLRIVDEDLNLYTYNEYNALSTKPTTIGVAIKDGDDWLVYNNSYINGSAGYQLASAGDDGLDPLIFAPQSASSLLYPHSGLDTSNIYKENYSSTTYASAYAATITDGGLSWYIPNLYEVCYIFDCVYDTTSGAHDGFNSHFELIYGDSSHNIIDSSPNPQAHAHWTSDVGYGGGQTAGQVHPYRVFFNGGNYVYRSSGNYTYAKNMNYTRPVARFKLYNVTYNGNGNTGGITPSDPTNYLPNSTVTVLNKGTLEKTGYIFNGWNTQADGSGTTYDPDYSSLNTFSIDSNITLYAIWKSESATQRLESPGGFRLLNKNTDEAISFGGGAYDGNWAYACATPVAQSINLVMNGSPIPASSTGPAHFFKSSQLKTPGWSARTIGAQMYYIGNSQNGSLSYTFYGIRLTEYDSDNNIIKVTEMPNQYSGTGISVTFDGMSTTATEFVQFTMPRYKTKIEALFVPNS